MFTLFLGFGFAVIFWNYGKEMRIGRWLSLAVFLASWFGFSSMGWELLSPVAAAILTGILVMILGHLKDEQRTARIRRKQRQEREAGCPNCGEPIVGPQTRCNRCGTGFHPQPA